MASASIPVGRPAMRGVVVRQTSCRQRVGTRLVRAGNRITRAVRATYGNTFRFRGYVARALHKLRAPSLVVEVRLLKLSAVSPIPGAVRSSRNMSLVSVVTALVVGFAACMLDASRYWALGVALVAAATIGLIGVVTRTVSVEESMLVCREWGTTKRIPLAHIRDLKLERYDGAFNSMLPSRRWWMVAIERQSGEVVPLYVTFQPRKKAVEALA